MPPVRESVGTATQLGIEATGQTMPYDATSQPDSHDALRAFALALIARGVPVLTVRAAILNLAWPEVGTLSPGQADALLRSLALGG